MPIPQDMIRIPVSAASEADLEVRIAAVTAALGTEVTVARGTVFNRHGMPPSFAALLCAVQPA